MEVAYLHVVTNHLPIFGVPLALALLLLGLWARDESVQRAALLLFVLLGAGTAFVYATGHGAEDFIEEVRRSSRDAIERHEDAAAWAFAAVMLLAVEALVLFIHAGGLGMLRRRATARKVSGPGSVTVLVTALGASAILGYTGRLGGQIAHTEFASSGAAVQDEARDRDDDGRKRNRNRRGRD